ncbi:RHS repeat-associated core domain-containing protein [Burkholderia territorii]|nr:RHS repeat-associated core domain-containing protein [Burkholderia territorii]
MHYNSQRYYDLQVGRFVGMVSIGLTGELSPYQYAPNPIAGRDGCCHRR